MTKPSRPGMTYMVGERKAVIRKVYTFGTMDVEVVSTGEWFRVTGLPFIKKD